MALIVYISSVIRRDFLFQNNFKDIDPSCKTEDSSCKMELMMSEEVGYNV